MQESKVDVSYREFQWNILPLSTLVDSAKENQPTSKDYQSKVTDASSSFFLVQVIREVIEGDREAILKYVGKENWLVQRLTLWIMVCKYVEYLLTNERDGKVYQDDEEVPDEIAKIVGVLEREAQEQGADPKTTTSQDQGPDSGEGLEEEWQWSEEDYVTKENWVKRDLQPKVAFTQWLNNELIAGKQDEQDQKAAAEAAKLFKNWIVAELQSFAGCATGAEWYAERMHI